MHEQVQTCEPQSGRDGQEMPKHPAQTCASSTKSESKKAFQRSI